MKKKTRPPKKKAAPDANETAYSVLQRIIQQTESPPPKPRKKPNKS